MDSTPRHVWVEKGGGLEKNGVLSKERRTTDAQKNNKRREPRLQTLNILYKRSFFVSDSSLCVFR